jgi:hypothetical protein
MNTMDVVNKSETRWIQIKFGTQVAVNGSSLITEKYRERGTECHTARNSLFG